MGNILEHRLAVQQNIEKGFNDGTNLNEELEKARSGVYEDTAKNRKLNRVGQHYGSKKQEDEPEPKPNGKGEEEPQGGGSSEGGKDMSSHASKASVGALKRAAADEKAPEEVRDAAKKELKKRGKGDDGGNDEKWKSVFDKMKKVDGNFTEEMYDDLSELAQEHGVDYDKEGEESLKKLPIEKVEKIVDAYSNGEVIEEDEEIKEYYKGANENQRKILEKEAKNAKSSVIKYSQGSKELDEFMDNNKQYFKDILNRYKAEDIEDLMLRAEEMESNGKDGYGWYDKVYVNCMKKIPAEKYVKFQQEY